jgi:AraC family transcriptional activator FtrA
LIRALRRAHADGARLVSICSGVFLLAETGMLDGKRVTAHWRHADRLMARYPNLHVEPDVLYVDEGSILTSAGSAAGSIWGCTSFAWTTERRSPTKSRDGW